MTPNELAALILGELGDSDQTIWTTAEMLDLIQESIYDFKIRTLCDWQRAALNDVLDQATYVIPDSLNFHQMDRAEYDSWVVNAKPPRVQMATNGYFETAGNRPFSLVMQGDGLRTVRKVGVPTANSALFIIEFFSMGAATSESPDDDIEDLPLRYLSYVARRVKSEAYKRDGDGQSLKMAKFWNDWYEDAILMMERRRERMYRRRVSNIGSDGKVPDGARRRDPGSLPAYFPKVE